MQKRFTWINGDVAFEDAVFLTSCYGKSALGHFWLTWRDLETRLKGDLCIFYTAELVVFGTVDDNLKQCFPKEACVYVGLLEL